VNKTVRNILFVALNEILNEMQNKTFANLICLVFT